MSITFKLVLIAILAFVGFISMLTIFIGTCSWLIDRFGWKGWVFVVIILGTMGYFMYDNFGDTAVQIIHRVQGLG